MSSRSHQPGAGPGPTIAISVAVYAVVLLTGMLLQARYQIVLLPRSAIMALAWLAIGPWLIRDGVRVSRELLEAYRPLFPTEEAWSELRRVNPGRPSADWLLFGVPWSVACTWLVIAVVYPAAQGLALLWAGFAFGTLFLLSGRGFWGVLAVVRFVRGFAGAGVTYRPYHPDHFGGFGAIGAYAARAALYFSSGALVLPLAFDAIGLSQTKTPTVAPLVSYLLTATFILFVLLAFVLPVVEIKRFADRERERVTAEARSRLDRLVEAYNTKANHDEQLARQIEMCFYMECGEFAKLREYPYDLKSVLELIVAGAVPVAVVVIESLLR